MKNNIFIDPGIIPENYVLSSIMDSEYNVVVFGELANLKYLLDHPEITYYSYDDFRMKQYEFTYEGKELYNKVFSEVISDYRTLQIEERMSFSLAPWSNSFNYLLNISDLVSYYVNLFCKYNPKFVFFHSTPHETCSWLLGRVAESLSIPVYTTILTALPWKSMLIKGLQKYEIIPIQAQEDLSQNGFLESFYQTNRKKYDEAIPSYEKKRIEARKGKFWSWKKEIKDCFRKPGIKWWVYFSLVMFRKHHLYKYYQSLTKQDLDLEQKYVIVFLHYQPERTTLPEGGDFIQQYNIIKTLRYGLPQDVKIYVKEHPSMFVNKLDVRYRCDEFYKKISLLPNVELVNIQIDSFSLIDHSIGVATVTGTVGIQSFIRGKNVFCFGRASYISFKHCHNIQSASDVSNAYDIMHNNADNERISEDFYLYLKELDKQSFSGVETNEIEDFYAGKYRLNSGGKVLHYLLSTKSIN